MFHGLSTHGDVVVTEISLAALDTVPVVIPVPLTGHAVLTL